MSASVLELLSFTLFNELLHPQHCFSYLAALVLTLGAYRREQAAAYARLQQEIRSGWD